MPGYLPPNPAFQWPNNDAPLTSNRICLRGKGWQGDQFPANVANIFPGMLLAVQADGGVIPHPVAGKPAERMFALEDALQGNVIQQAYNIGDPVQTTIGLPGDEIYMYLAANATTFTKGAGLTSDGAGGVKVTTTSTDSIVGVAMDAYTSQATQTWVRARVYG